MAYFFSHIIYICVAAVIIALLGVSAVFMAQNNAKHRDKQEAEKRKEACTGCAMAGMCMNMGQPEVCDKPEESK